ncbi:MAG: hypothetical protein IKU50_00620 [Bacteroidaceae bacterium]|nr:hypothetical protein [Bacteroidaceae bacterium]
MELNKQLKKYIKRIFIAFFALSFIFCVLVIVAFLYLMGAINIKNKTDYLVLWEWWWNKDSNGESIIDLAEVMPFDWDYFVVRNLGGENEITVNGVSYSLLQDEAVSFIKDDKVVFSEVWYKDDYTYQYFIKGSVHFRGNCSCVKKEDAKFKAKKNEPGYLILEKIE